VTDDIAPHYSEIIIRPVALRTMLQKAEAFGGATRYPFWQQARADFDKLLSNCKVTFPHIHALRPACTYDAQFLTACHAFARQAYNASEESQWICKEAEGVHRLGRALSDGLHRFA
jgi:hypothetical protein